MEKMPDLMITMMSFLLWRCLHSGPLTVESIDHPEPNPIRPWTSAPQ
jgi:hypothetical protein